METDLDWQNFLHISHDCSQSGDIDKAKQSASQLYDSIGLFYREKMDNEAVCDAYKKCMELSVMINDHNLEVKCFYRTKFHSRDYMDPEVMWKKVLTKQEIKLAPKLKMIRDARSIIDQYESTYETDTCISIYRKEIQYCYKALYEIYGADKFSAEIILREILQYEMGNGWKLLSEGKPEVVCELCKRLSKGHSSDPDIASVMVLWAHALEQLGMLDVAMNKVENAIAMATPTHDMHSSEELLSRLRTKAVEMHEESVKAKQATATVKGEEKGVMIMKTQSPKKKKTKCGKVKQLKKKQNEFEESYIVESEGLDTNPPKNNEPNKTEELEMVPTMRDDYPKTWKDVTDFDLPISRVRRKRRRKRNSDSDLFSNGNGTETIELRREANVEGSDNYFNLHLVESDEGEEEYQPLPSCLSNELQLLDPTSSFNPPIKEGNEEDDLQKDTFFSESCQRTLKTTDNELKTMHDINEQILQNGLELSDQFIGSFKRRETKFKGYLNLYSKEESLFLCSKYHHMYKHCRITIETSHRAVCTVLDENDIVKTIEISGRTKCGKVYNEDEVVVKILNALSQNGEKLYGQVVGIVKRTRFAAAKNPVFLCTLDEFEMHLTKPLCKTVPKISILRNKYQSKFQVKTYRYDENTNDLKFEELKPIDPANRKGYLFIVCLICWNEVYPVGAVLSVHSYSANTNSSLKVLCLQNQIRTHYNDDTVQLTNDIVQNTKVERTEEIRKYVSDDHMIFTIDPAGSKDFDDALSVKKLGDDRYEIGVHIADVASLVMKGDAIDKEAQERTRTFYPGEGYRPHHMIPEPLSTNICSLLPNKNRNAISVFFVVTSSGDVSNTTIKRTIVKSSRQLTYQEAQSIISCRHQNIKSELDQHIRVLNTIAKELRKKRLGNKRFAFPFEPDYVGSKHDYHSAEDAHNLVEEYMILTNHHIAKFLLDKFPNCVPLVVHKEPSLEKVREWMGSYPVIGNFVLGIQHSRLPDKTVIDVCDDLPPLNRDKKIFPIQLHVWKKLTSALMKSNFEEAQRIIGTDAIHPQQALALEEWISFQESAKYRCSGSLERNNRHHFSLGIHPYTHCTSPIRRYSDIIIQRLIHAALDKKISPYTMEEVGNVCENINNVTKRGKAFEKQCFALHFGKKLSKKPVLSNAMVQSVSEKEVTLHFPGMRKLPKDCKDIPYGMLRPTVMPSKESKSCVSIVWKQRLYSLTGYGSTIRPMNNERRIDPHQRVTFQHLLKWQRILEAIFENKHSQLKAVFFGTDHPDVNMKQFVPACSDTEADVSSEVRDGNIIHQCCDFSMSLSHSQILAVQLMAEPKKGVMVPSVQMVDVTNNVKLCLQHISDPVKCFASYSTETVPNQIKSPEEYARIWLNIFRMESAVNMAQRMPVVINDLPIQFSDGLDMSDCVFVLQNSFCLKRDIEFGCLSQKMIIFGEENNDEEKESQFLLSSDCVCIRCDLVNGIPLRVTNDMPPNDRHIWIGHGKICILQEGKRNDKRKIHIRLHKDSPRPTSEMCSKPPPQCSVELLQKSDADKRVEATLSCLSKATELAKAIALGNMIPRLDKDHFDLSQKVEADLTICRLARNNTQQLKAIKRALSNRFSLIQGPPGTGKTYTGIKLIYLFVKINDILRKEGGEHKQVVFCGPSNKSVDLVARWMLNKLNGHTPSIVRMYGSSLENSDFRIPGRDYTGTTPCKDNRPDPELANISLHHRIREEGKPYAEELRNYDTMFENNPNFSDHSKIRNYKKVCSKACQEELKHYAVIFCTTAVATNASFLKATKGKIYQLIIDEAGMCTEPETLAPIIATRAEQVVLIGDHKQLQPVVLCKEAESLGLKKSLFERYASIAVFLNNQYRMNPEICDFPSKQFYQKKLKTKPSIAWKVIEPLSLWKVPTVPLLFCHVEGEEHCLSVTTAEGNQQSKSNMAEVEEVVRIFRELITREKVNQKQINIISQYNAQCNAIKKTLKEQNIMNCNVNVNTVVASQGGEWDYVIFSTVRSLPEYKIESSPTKGWCKQNLGFITDQHQINVALTRARKGLIIIGNKRLMKCDEVWNKLLTHYVQKDCVVDAGCVKSKRQKKQRRTREATEEEFNTLT